METLAFALLLATALFPNVHATMVTGIAGETRKAFHREGDLNIGYIRRKICTEDAITFSSTMKFEYVAFIIDKINNDATILPNITLGLVGIVGCNRPLQIMAKSMYFIAEDDTPLEPTLDMKKYPHEYTLEDFRYNDSSPSRHYVVSGVVGLMFSSYAVPAASILGAFGIPLMSHFATSDELSDKSKFPHFMRTVPPDKFSTEALVSFAQHFNWTYVSLLYSDDTYGEYGGKRLEKLIRDADMCIAYSHRIPLSSRHEDYEEIVQELYKNRKARVVIMFADKSVQSGLHGAIERLNLLGYFLFLTGDLFSPNSASNGSVYITHYDAEDFKIEFNEYKDKVTPWQQPANQFLPDAWREKFNCTWNKTNSTIYPSCYDFKIDSTESFWVSGRLGISVYVYAYAMHAMITEKCPEMFTSLDKAKLRECVKSDELFPYMIEVNRNIFGQHVKFDSQGDVLGSYVLSHYSIRNGTEHRIPVGTWDKLTNTLQVNTSLIDWEFLKDKEYFETNPADQYILESVCSKECGGRQYYHQLEVACCWECRECRDNERLINNATACEECPTLTWPDTPHHCTAIPPYYLRLADSALAKIILILGIMFIAVTIACAAAMYYYRDHRLIRSTSRGLSAIILAGTLLCCLTVPMFLLKPTDSTCLVRLLGFHYGVNLLYSPLMVKTIRIYRIFAAGRRSVRRPKFVSSGAQMVFISTLVLLQTGMLVVSDTVWPVRSSLEQKHRSERHVELQCTQEMVAFLLPLSVNLCVIAVCSVLAYLSRNLPENFNESFYLFVSSATTAFAWTVVLPTYFSAFHAYQQTILLAFCLLLHAIVTLGCMFAPKLYALICIDDDAKLNVVGTTTSKIVPNTSKTPTATVGQSHVSTTSHKMNEGPVLVLAD